MAAMTTAAAAPSNFLIWPKINADDLRHVQDPCVILEAEWKDSDGVTCYAFTVGGWLNGNALGNGAGSGVTIGGDVAIVHADSREEAKLIAAYGLLDTIAALTGEEKAYQEAHAALARLQSVNPQRRIDLAAAAPADKSDDFQADTEAIRKLRGDDIVLTVGGVEGGPEGAPH